MKSNYYKLFFNIVLFFIFGCNIQSGNNDNLPNNKLDRKIKIKYFDKIEPKFNKIDTLIINELDTFIISFDFLTEGNFKIYDTIFYVDTTVNIYKDRIIIIEVKNSKINRKMKISKKSLERFYDNYTISKSILAQPKIKEIDISSQRVLVEALFGYPHSFEGDFFETLTLDISFDGIVKITESY